VPEALRFPYQARMDDLRSADKDRQNAAFTSLGEATQVPVDWAYEVWDDLLSILVVGDNRQRAIGAQILCNLATSDPHGRMVQDVEALLGVTKGQEPLLKSTTLLTSPKARGKKALPSCTTCRYPRRVHAGNRSGVTPPVYDGALLPDRAGKRWA